MNNVLLYKTDTLNETDWFASYCTIYHFLETHIFTDPLCSRHGPQCSADSSLGNPDQKNMFDLKNQQKEENKDFGYGTSVLQPQHTAMTCNIGCHFSPHRSFTGKFLGVVKRTSNEYSEKTRKTYLGLVVG